MRRNWWGSRSGASFCPFLLMILIVLLILLKATLAQRIRITIKSMSMNGKAPVSPVDHPDIRATIPSPFLGCRA